MKSKELAGMVALVTGAGRGIGRATARCLHESGAAVAIVDVDGEAGGVVQQEIEWDRGHAATYTIDLADSDRVSRLVDDVVAAQGRLDILINSAGITGQGPLLEISDAAWDRAMAVNLKAPFLLTRAFGRHAAQRGGGGKIVNVLSSSLFRALFHSGPDYVTSKGGLLGLTRTAAGYLAPFDVNVNAVVPGMTDTGRMRRDDETDEQHAALLKQLVSQGPLENPFQRVSTPEDVARVIVFLCSSASRQITGQVVHTSAGAVV